MRNFSRFILVAGAAAAAGACSDSTTTPVSSTLARAALASAPISFDQINTSFVGSSDANAGFVPGFSDANGEFEGVAGGGGGGHHDGDGGPGWTRLMGGGIADVFRGRILFGGGFGRGPFGDLRNDSNCAFSSTDNRITCGTLTRRGLTVDRSFQYLDASGTVQQAFDTGTTNSVNVRTAVGGTRVHHDGNDTSTVDSKSDITVTGLATGSTQRTVNGTASGTENSKGITRDGVAFTAVRTAGDTATGVVIPLQNGRPTYPTAGTIVRSMQATVTLSGQTPTMSSRREVITFDGTDTAQVSVTQDGVTKTGTLSLVGEGLNCHD
jgi:hypothetical protein